MNTFIVSFSLLVCSAAPFQPRLNNADFSAVADGQFIGWSPVGRYMVDGQTAIVQCKTASESTGLVQNLQCDPPLNEPFTASAFAKAENVGGEGEFSVYIDLIHTDGSPTWGNVAGFSRGTHDWEKAAVDIQPVKPVKEIRFHLLLRNTTGKAWFRQPSLVPTPLRFERQEAVADLWKPHSLSIRAETNLPARITALAGDRILAKAEGERLSAEMDDVTADSITIRAESPTRAENAASVNVQPIQAKTSSTPAFRTWSANSMRRIFTDTFPLLQNPDKPLTLEAARDGHVSFQVAITAPPRIPVDSLQVEIGDMKNTDGRTLSKTAWKRYRVGFIRAEQPVKHPFLEHRGPSWWPDPLLPYQPVKVPAGETRAVLLDTRIPADQAPGLYAGEVIVRTPSGTTEHLPISLRIHSFTIPARPRIKTAFALMDGFLEKIYGTITPELRRAYTTFVLDHRLNPDDISRTRLPDLDEMSWAKEHGLNAFNVLNLVPEPVDKVTWVCFAPTDAYTEMFKRRLVERLDSFVPELEKCGLLEYAYVYGFDERGDDYLPIIRDCFGLIKQRYPKLRTLSTCWPPAGTDPLSLNIDWYCPLSSKYDMKTADEVRRRGGQMWWYICMGPTYPYANWLFEYPLIEARLIWWQTWQQRVDGFLYWGLNIWDRPHNEKPIPSDADPCLQWSITPFEPLHGDGVLLYPGADGPIGSLRLTSIRDGIEDMAILDAAEQRLGREKVETLIREVSQNLTEFTHDPEVLLAVRHRLLELLDQ